MKDIEKKYLKAEIPNIDNSQLEHELRANLIKAYELDKSSASEYVKSRTLMRFAFAMCTVMIAFVSVLIIKPELAVNAHNMAFSKDVAVCEYSEPSDSLIKLVEASYFDEGSNMTEPKYIVEKYVSKELGTITYIKDPKKIENMIKAL